MSGHSKWHNIQGRKNAQDAKRGKIFQKISRDLYQAAKAGDFTKADSAIQAANEAIVKAHHGQTELLTKAANGEAVDVSIYMVHAQDHLMTGIAFVDLAKEIIALYQVIQG
ncbi:MAG: PTS lactose/cellobiose transporter subunit IIA [Lactococcus sp.]|nr:PTS lactose/cellobiose transporter subunit IIA [Lactococcus sp.]